MFSDSYKVMEFMVLFSLLILICVFILKFLNKNATPLRKSWNVYISMSALNLIFFMGLHLFLPPTTPSSQYDYNQEIEKIETIQDAKSILREQRREINELKDYTDTFKNILWDFTLMSVLFIPMIYYNLIKSNLEIEKLSGKRMGSLD